MQGSVLRVMCIPHAETNVRWYRSPRSEAVHKMSSVEVSVFCAFLFTNPLGAANFFDAERRIRTCSHLLAAKKSCPLNSSIIPRFLCKYVEGSTKRNTLPGFTNARKLTQNTPDPRLHP